MKYSVLVKAGSAKDLVEEISNGLVVRTRAKAHDNEANKAVVKLLSKYFDVGKTKIKIVRGETSKHKIIEIN